MNMRLAIRMKEFVSSPVMGKKIIIITLCAATFFLASNFGTKAYAQENNNNTLILEDMRAIMRDQQQDISSIRNTSSADVEALTNMGTNLAKLTTQGAYTALSVFFLGIGLVVFGLRLTTRTSPQIGRYFSIMVWALTLPVCVLIGLFQYGEITGNNPLASIGGSEEPYFLLSFLLYIPIGIVVFLLVEQKGIVQDQAAQISRPIQEMEKLVGLREKG
jgi:hypothetical protein